MTCFICSRMCITSKSLRMSCRAAGGSPAACWPSMVQVVAKTSVSESKQRFIIVIVFSNRQTSFVEKIFDFPGKRIVKVIGHGKFALRRTQHSTFDTSVYRHQPGHRHSSPGNDDFF